MTREQAKIKVELLDNYLSHTCQDYGERDHEAMMMAIKALEQEPKTGHWVHGEYCSECGCDVPAYIVDWKWQKDMNAKYCPNCGAKMKSEGKE